MSGGAVISCDRRTRYSQLGIKRGFMEEKLFLMNFGGKGEQVWWKVHSRHREQCKEKARITESRNNVNQESRGNIIKIGKNGAKVLLKRKWLRISPH